MTVKVCCYEQLKLITFWLARKENNKTTQKHCTDGKILFFLF